MSRGDGEKGAEERGPHSSAASGLALLTGSALFALALLVRALPYPTVFTPDRVVFFGMDAYYHMRRVLYSLQRFPEALSFDPYINFPHGAKPIWPPLFDSTVALLVWPFYAAGGEPAAEAAAVWLPPLLGAATVAALFFAARRFFDLSTAALAGLALCFLSAHSWYSQLGFVDHHAAVALVSTLLLLSAMSLLRALATRTDTQGIGGPALATALSLAIALLLWPGSLLHVALIEVGLFAFLLTRERHADALRAVAALALLHGVAFLILLPFTATSSWPQWGDYSPTVLSRFQPWLFAALTLHTTACWFVWRRRPSSNRAQRALQLLGLAVAVLLASALLFPGLWTGARDAWQWLAKDEAFQASVAESLPLFELNGAFSVRIAEGRLSYFIYLLPLGLGAMALSVRARADRAAIWMFVAWTLGLLAVTLVQRRFFNSLSVSLALVLGWSVCEIARRASARIESGPLRATVFLAGALALLAVAMAPVWESYRLQGENFARARRGEAPVLRSAGPDLAGLLIAASWLRANTPPTSGYFETSAADGSAVRPEYGVLARSGSGHVLEYVARRPTLSNNFGDDIGRGNFEQVQHYFRAHSEAEGLRIADELGARYVLVDDFDAGARRDPNSLAARLALGDGSGLQRHRLVFESSKLGRGPSARAHKIFEVVPGARLVGRAPAGQTVKLRLDLQTNRARKVVYRAKARADAQGQYAFRLPYATTGSKAAPNDSKETRCCTLPVSLYRIDAAGRSDSFSIDEVQVQRGATLRGPDFGS